MSKTEQRRARWMIGETFTVDEIDRQGLAWVTKVWDLGSGDYDAHGIGLSPSEIELVE